MGEKSTSKFTMLFETCRDMLQRRRAPKRDTYETYETYEIGTSYALKL